MAAPPRSFARAALGGLAAGLLLAAMALGGLSLQRATQACEAPGTEECTFELQTAREIARLQALAALGCALLGGGLALTARRR
jgi:hypothetical protein